MATTAPRGKPWAHGHDTPGGHSDSRGGRAAAWIASSSPTRLGGGAQDRVSLVLAPTETSDACGWCSVIAGRASADADSAIVEGHSLLACKLGSPIRSPLLRRAVPIVR